MIGRGEQSDGKRGQDDARDEHVEPVALGGEHREGEEHADDGGEDQEEEAMPPVRHGAIVIRRLS